LGTACAAVIVAVVVQLARGSDPIGKDFIGIPLIALLVFLLRVIRAETQAPTARTNPLLLLQPGTATVLDHRR
jgi:hypothetical protein